MSFKNELKKAMIDCDVKGARELADKSGLTYNKVIRALNGDGSSRYVDILLIASVLDLKIEFITKGDK